MKISVFTFLFVCIIGLMLKSLVSGDTVEPPLNWGFEITPDSNYAAPTEIEWSRIYPNCSSFLQAPVDITSSEAQYSSALKPIRIVSNLAGRRQQWKDTNKQRTLVSLN